MHRSSPSEKLRYAAHAVLIMSLTMLSGCASGGAGEWHGVDYQMAPHGPVGILGPSSGIF